MHTLTRYNIIFDAGWLDLRLFVVSTAIKFIFICLKQMNLLLPVSMAKFTYLFRYKTYISLTFVLNITFNIRRWL